MEAEQLAEDTPVSGSELRQLREARGLTVAELADLLNAADGRTTSEQASYANAALSAVDVGRFEQSLLHQSFVRRVEKLLAERNGNMNNDNGTDLQAASKAAREAAEQFESDEAEAQSLVAELNATIDKLYAMGGPVHEALQRRYQSYVRAVQAERRRSKLANDTSHEDALHIRPFRRNVPPPSGVIVTVELNCEMGLTVPRETDDSLAAWRSVEYLGDAADGVPFDAKERRRQRARAGV